MIREIDSKKIAEAVSKLAVEACTELPEDVLRALKAALKKESSSSGKEVLKQLLENARIAREEKLPICQDTGFAVVFVDLGADVSVRGATVEEAVNEGVRRGYSEGFLRKSIVASPFRRENTKDNTPADVIIDIVPGSEIRITFMAKGGGSENVSALRMFNPSADFSEISAFVVDEIANAGPNPCPPVIIGLGIGGTADKAMLLAKKALLREVGRASADKETAKKEKELLAAVNKTGVGPSGLGGNTTALAVHIETFPCHIASLPVALAVDCHAHRIKRAII